MSDAKDQNLRDFKVASQRFKEALGQTEIEAMVISSLRGMHASMAHLYSCKTIMMKCIGNPDIVQAYLDMGDIEKAREVVQLNNWPASLFDGLMILEELFFVEPKIKEFYLHSETLLAALDSYLSRPVHKEALVGHFFAALDGMIALLDNGLQQNEIFHDLFNEYKNRAILHTALSGKGYRFCDGSELQAYAKSVASDIRDVTLEEFAQCLKELREMTELREVHNAAMRLKNVPGKAA